MWKAKHFHLARLHLLIAVLIIPFVSGCLTDRDFRQVFGENIVLTSAVVIQTLTAQLFNGLFSIFTI